VTTVPSVRAFSSPRYSSDTYLGRFNWTFTRRDLHALLAKIAVKRLAPAA